MKRFTSSYGLAFGVGLVLAVVASLSIVLVRADDDQRPYGPLDSDVPDEVRAANYATARAKSTETYNQTVREFLASGASVSDLARYPVAANYADSAYDLTEASVAASDIVRGIVTGQRVIARSDGSAPSVVSTISVSQWLKGGSGDTIVELVQYGAPVPLQDGRIGLSYLESDPVVRLDAEVIVFSGQRDDSGRLMALPYKILVIEAGRVRVNPIDAKMESQDRSELAALLGEVQNAVLAQQGDSQ